MDDILLGGGLDLITTKAKAPSGFLEDCENYEVGAEQGYRPSGGFERFDGHISPSTVDIWDVTVDNIAITPAVVATRSQSMTADTVQTGITFKPDGTLMYMAGTGSNKVYEYILSTPWDITTASNGGNSIVTTTGGGDSDPQSVAFSSDGLMAFVLGNATNVIDMFEIFHPWAIGGGYSLEDSKFLVGWETSPKGIYFSPDGIQMYVVGSQVGQVHRWILSTAWTISTAVFSASFTISLYQTTPTGVQFASDGYVFYVSDTNGKVYAYACTTAWDISTAAYFAEYTRGGADIVDLYMTPDDGRMFLLGVTDDLLYEYGWGFSPNEPIEWATIGDSGSVGVVVDTTIRASQTTIRLAYWDANDNLPPGATATGANGATFQEGLESLHDTTKTLDVSSEDSAPNGLWFKPDGLTCYVAGDTNTSIFQYTLTKPWDLATGAYAAKVKSVAAQTTFGPFGVVLDSTGSIMHVIGYTSIYEYDLATPWDVSTATFSGSAVSVPNCYGITLSSDGTKLYVVYGELDAGAGAQSYIRQYTLLLGSLAGAVPDATVLLDKDLTNGAFEENTVTGISFTADGLSFFVTLPVLYEVHRYDCTTAWDISTLVPSGVFVEHTADTVRDIFVSGTHLYLVGWTDTLIHQYDLYADAVMVSLVDAATDINDYQNALATAADVLREAIAMVPGSGPVLGKKWYRDSLYSFRDYFHFNFREGNNGEIKVGQHVVIADGTGGGSPAQYGDEGIVRSVVLKGGSLSDGSGYGAIIIEPLEQSFNWQDRLLYGLLNNGLQALAELYFTSGSTEPLFNENLQGQTSTVVVKVWRVELRSGSWAAGDAAGIVFCLNTSGTITDGELFDCISPAAVNIFTADAKHPVIYGAKMSTPNVIYHSPNKTGAAIAGMYRSSRGGWEKIDLGAEIRFITGLSEPNPVRFGADTSSAVISISSWSVATAELATLGALWTPSAGTRIAALAASGGTYINPASSMGPDGLKEAKYPIAMYGFDLDIPIGARVIGVEIEVTAKNASAATHDAGLVRVQPFLYDSDQLEGGVLPGVVPKRQAVGDLTNAFVAYTFGGENDLWGAAIDREMVMDTNFGVKCSIEWEGGGTTANMQIDFIRIRVHYVEQGQLFYFYDSVGLYDYATARLVHFNLETGSWAGSDAAGTMQIYNLTKPQIPTKNIQIWTAAGGTGTHIADMSGNEQLISLAGHKLLKEQNSKYELITENVYSRDDLEAIYGVSGAGPAFSYDGYYFRVIRTGLSPDLDKPRHLALFQFRMWLGYIFGEVNISVAGEPLLFDGTLNAVATGFGRPVTGLSPLAGKTMGVFTDRSVYAVTVEGIDFDQQVFAPNAGCREYTTQNTGTQVMYADPRGISTPETSQNYGDFDISPLSRNVHSWLLPRVQSREGADARGRFDAVAATVSRAKNQYRLYFADGYRMTLTLRGAGQAPEITKQFLYLNDDPDQYVRVLATESEVGSDGRERIFFSMDVNPDYDLGDAIGYCYEEDRGLSYDGSEYVRWIELSPVSGRDIHSNVVWGFMHLYGMAHGHAALSLTTAKDFAHPADPDTVTEDSLYRLVLGAATQPVSTVMKAYFNKGKIAARGRHVSLRIQNKTDRELPHILQLVALETTAARPER